LIRLGRYVATSRSFGGPSRIEEGKIDPENLPAHKLIAENFQGWIGAVRECIAQIEDRVPPGTDPDALATYVLAVMEGGVMLSRSYASVEPFDRTIAQLRHHFRLLLPAASRDADSAY
jgi:TetR/AcrR family transcriptional repressor of nem operon